MWGPGIGERREYEMNCLEDIWIFGSLLMGQWNYPSRLSGKVRVNLEVGTRIDNGEA
jgi:hypothetical protein